MKKKALILALLCVMGISIMSVSNAGATVFTCTVQSAGIDVQGFVTVFLTDPVNIPTSTIFIVSNTATNKNQILAAALTALSTGGHLVADLSGTTAYSSLMGALAAP